jgi:hypothetical protein
MAIAEQKKRRRNSLKREELLRSMTNSGRVFETEEIDQAFLLARVIYKAVSQTSLSTATTEKDSDGETALRAGS